LTVSRFKGITTAELCQVFVKLFLKYFFVKQVNKLIGLNIKRLRESKKMTVDELADATKLDRQSIYNYEDHSHEPRIGNLREIANYFKVSVDFIRQNTEEISAKLDNLTTNESLSREDLLMELVRVNKKLEEVLTNAGKDKDKIIELQERIDQLKDQLGRDQG
jgi:transcriptional regulator with XRE-family HTH domain